MGLGIAWRIIFAALLGCLVASGCQGGAAEQAAPADDIFKDVEGSPTRASEAEKSSGEEAKRAR
jgi:hypothetical protein